MSNDADILFSPLALARVTLPNRIIRSATYEGLGDAGGAPLPELAEMYLELARGGVGTIISGFVYTSQQGRAMQPAQCGMDHEALIAPWGRIVQRVRTEAPHARLFLQLAHAGRQTLRRVTRRQVVGASRRRCSYFRQSVAALHEEDIACIIAEFASAAGRAQAAGFDGVQLHAAHGYLLHQFLSPYTNIRRDRWSEPALLLREVILAVRKACGAAFPILLKLSAGEDSAPALSVDNVVHTVSALDPAQIDALEISYGTMEYALNIMRGDLPLDLALRINPLYNRYPPVVRAIWKRLCYPGYQARVLPFTENYNVEAAIAIARTTPIPVIPVGGLRSVTDMARCVHDDGLAAVALCRPLICEPDLPRKLRDGVAIRSRCTNCNLCTIHCDSDAPLRCYIRKG